MLKIKCCSGRIGVRPLKRSKSATFKVSMCLTRQRGDLLRELGQRIEPCANLCRCALPPSIRRTRRKLLGQNLLNKRFKRKAARLGFGHEFVRDVDSYHH